MPFALVFVGVVMLVAGVRAKQDELYTAVKGDVSGSGSYVGWMVSILFIGALGYIEAIRPISRAFLVLLVIVLMLRNGGFWQKFNEQVFSSQPKTDTTVSTSPFMGGVLQTTMTVPQ